MSIGHFEHEFIAPDWSKESNLALSLVAAELIYCSLAEFYDIFSVAQENLFKNIAHQLGEPHTEVGNTKLLQNENGIVGVYSVYTTDEMKDRQMASLKMLMGIDNPRDDMLVRLKSFRQQVIPVESTSLYLARIAVDEKFRGLGIGQKLIQAVENDAHKLSLSAVSLHVKATNDRAIRFYKAGGYKVTSPETLDYLVMEKNL